MNLLLTANRHFRRCLLVLFFFVGLRSSAQAQCDTVHVPDVAFANFLAVNFPGVMNPTNDSLYTCPAALVTGVMDCSGQFIADLTGIEHFTGIAELNCSFNQLTSLPSLPPNLQFLNVADNPQLERLPVLPHSLCDLQCHSTLITCLPNWPACPTFTNTCGLSFSNICCDTIHIPDPAFAAHIAASYPGAMNATQDSLYTCVFAGQVGSGFLNLANLNISDFTGIEYFFRFALITQLFLDNNPIGTLPELPNELTYLSCTNNQLTALPVHLPDSLLEFYCSQNQLTNLPDLPALLTTLDCSDNALTSLPTLPPNLLALQCGTNQLTTLPTLPSSITTIGCTQNQLTSLPALPLNLESFIADFNQLSSLPALPNGVKLISAFRNQLTSLPALPAGLEILWVSFNQLTSIPALPATLRQLWCSFNQITALPALPTATSFVRLDCDNNQLTTLPALPAGLKYLFCQHNNIPALPATLPSTLEWHFNCGNNPLTVLPPIPPGVTELSVDSCQFTVLPSLPNGLQTLNCQKNQLRNLPILPNTLCDLKCADNPALICLPNIPTCPTFTSSCGLTLCSTAGVCDTVHIPDANFAAFLVATYPTVMNATGDSLLTCQAELITGHLDCNFQNITDLSGIEYFTAIDSLTFNDNNVSSFPTLVAPLRKLVFSNNVISNIAAPFGDSLRRIEGNGNLLTALPTLPAVLEHLECDNNDLRQLPVMPATLTELHCAGNNLTVLPALPAQMLYFDAANNNISSIANLPNPLVFANLSGNNFSFLPALPGGLRELYCDRNNISSIPALNASLERFSCSFNQLATLPTLPSGLLFLNASHNVISTLPTIPGSVTWLDISHNQLTSFNLGGPPTGVTELYCSHNRLQLLPPLPIGLTNLDCSNNDSLNTLPTLPDNLCTLDCDSTGIVCLPNIPACPTFTSTCGLTLCPAGIGDAQGNGMHLAPNPTAGHLQLTAPELTGQNLSLRLYDAFGRDVLHLEHNAFSGSLQLDLSHLPIGLYVLQVQTSSQMLSQRVLVSGK